MNREQMQWESPAWEIIFLDAQDVIQTSANGVAVEDSGFGTEVPWTSLFSD